MIPSRRSFLLVTAGRMSLVAALIACTVSAIAADRPDTVGIWTSIKRFAQQCQFEPLTRIACTWIGGCRR